MSAARRKGTAAETAVANWLRQWWPHTERRALNGQHDRGDITGIPSTVIEIKNAKTITLAAWTDELQTEIANDNADIGWLVIKRRGTTNPANWYWITTGDIAVQLMKEAGR